jgi:GntR family transcriptional regulator, transcriptional repressor for pyruvate dehydrogenase complex
MSRAGSAATTAEQPTVTQLVELLRGRIHRGELGPGDRLPAERDLVEQLGVGRPRLREALAQLEADGYVVTRRGATGGRFVTELQRPFRRWATSVLDELDDIVDFRLAVECQAVRFAAMRRSDSDLAAIEASMVALAAAMSPRDYRLADVAFHHALAEASRSPRLVEAVERARGELFEPVDKLWEAGLDQTVADHRRIVDAVTAADHDAAAAAMAAHIEGTRRELRDLLA